MKHLSIILPAGAAILDTIVGTYNLFKMANSYSKKLGLREHDLFQIDLVGLNDQARSYQGLFQVKPTRTIDEVKQTDLIIISGITGNLDDEIIKNQAFIDWIRQHRVQHGTEIASLCRSAFILAETGLLNGKDCATHWIVQQKFAQQYPKVNLVSDKIICEDNGIYSSGGAYSFLNLILYLIEKYYGREVAIFCSKVAEIEVDRFNQDQFAIFNGQKDHSDEVIKEAQLYIEDKFEEKLSVKELARKFAISDRNFIRRFKKATMNTPSEYIQRVRIEAAKKSLESSVLNVNEVMYNVGYMDEKAFRRVFKKYTGLSPIEYRYKYNREMAFA